MNMFSESLAITTKRALAGAILAIGLAACATVPEDPAARQAYDEANDPLEPFNRGVFAVNKTVDTYVGKPIAIAYDEVIPDYGKDRIRNVIDNLREPINFINNMFQAKWGRAWSNVERFAVNSTAGVLGIWDVSDAAFDIKPAQEDFGQTLAVWGADEGPFLMLPLLGPSNVRDGFGLAGDALMDPVNIAQWTTGLKVLTYVGVARFVTRGIDSRARVLTTLDEIEKTSVDFYATLRSLYRQNRNDEIRDGQPGNLAPLPEISFKFEDDTNPGPQAAVTN